MSMAGLRAFSPLPAGLLVKPRRRADNCRMLRLRSHVWICLGFLLALLAVGWGGALLAQGFGLAPPKPPWNWLLLGLVFALLLGFAFSAIPVMVLLVTGAQRGIGSPAAGLAAPRTQDTIVYVLWALMAVGAAIALPTAFLLGAFGDVGAGLDPGASRGTLVAKPGMTIAQVKQASSLPIETKDDSATMSGGVVFDFQVAGTAIRLPRCRYYFASTYMKDRGRIEGMSIGASTQKATLAQIGQADDALRRALVADGWLAGHEVYRTEDDRQLHGGAERGPDGDMWLKDGVVLDISRKRMDDEQAGEPAGAGEWIQVVDLWAKPDYPWIERYEFAAPE
jgi:hypothetical protein